MNKTNQLMCIWSTLVFVVLFSIGWVPLAGFIPPPSPVLDAGTIAAMYQESTGLIRAGLAMMIFSTGFYIPFSTAIGVQLRRIEGPNAVMASTSVIGGALVCGFALLPELIWTAAAFRPERSPELTQLFNDFGWFCLAMPAAPAVIQTVAIGIGILSDRSDKPVYPRWTGYFSIWAGVIFLPGLLITFFKSGAFAWNGLLGFWLPILVFFAWVMIMIFATHKAIVSQPERG